MPLWGQWQKTSGPEGGYARALYSVGSTLFVGVNYGGVYRSTDGGTSWAQANTGLPQSARTIEGFSSLGNTLFVETTDGIFASSDGGTTWTAVATTLAHADVTEIASVGQTLFASTVVKETVQGTTSTLSECVYRSADAGVTWTAVSSKIPKSSGEKFTIFAAGTTLYAASDRAGLYRTTDNGTTWAAVNNGLTGNSLRLHITHLAVDDKYLYAATRAGVYRSPNTGEPLWTAANAGMKSGVEVQTIVSAAGGTLYSATEGTGVFRSTDAGTTWTAVNKGLGNLYCRALFAAGGNLYAALDGAGVFRVSMGMETTTGWTQINKGINSGATTYLGASGGVVFAGTSGNGVWRSLDGGTTWVQAKGINDPPQGDKGASAYVNEISKALGKLYAATFGGVFVSTDSAATWTNASGNLSGLALAAYAVAEYNGSLMAATDGGLYASTDGGAKWTLRSSTLPDTVAAFDFGRLGATLYAATAGSGVWRSTDGSTWISSNRGLPISALKVYRFATLGTVLYAATSDGIYSTSDGTQWTARNTGFGTIRLMYDILAVGSTLVATGDAGVYRSTNSGASWQTMSQGLTNTANYALAADDRYFYIGDDSHGDGVWRRPLSELTSVQSFSVSGDALSIEQFPNPFTGTTTLRFHLDKPQRVGLSVYDMLGKLITTESARLMSAGECTFQVQLSDVPSGVYVYRLTTESGVNAGLMRLTR
jgi:photosystem II stability/assembly factor-like uncharacterized protein